MVCRHIPHSRCTAALAKSSVFGLIVDGLGDHGSIHRYLCQQPFLSKASELNLQVCSMRFDRCLIGVFTHPLSSSEKLLRVLFFIYSESHMHT